MAARRAALLAGCVCALVGVVVPDSGVVPIATAAPDLSVVDTSTSRTVVADVAIDHLIAVAAERGSNLRRSDLAVIGSQRSDRNGTTTVYVQQSRHGIEVRNAMAVVTIDDDLEVRHAPDRFVDSAPPSIRAPRPTIDAVAAVTAAATQVGDTGAGSLVPIQLASGVERSQVLSGGDISAAPIPVRLVYEPDGSGDATLAWDALVEATDSNDTWRTVIDASTGVVLHRRSLVLHDSFGVPDDLPGIDDATGSDAASSALAQVDAVGGAATVPRYRVVAQPAASPTEANRVLVDDPSDDLASPFGWHDLDGRVGADTTTTTGNNVDAYLDTDADDQPDPFSRPDGGTDLRFDFPFNPAAPPAGSASAIVTNLFYWTNVMHDVLYAYGFDEQSGNFQFDNYGRGGRGGDALLAEALDGHRTNNADFRTPPDGVAPRLQMQLFTDPDPDRSSAMDATIIAHEYTHGVTTRLTGGPSTSWCLTNAEQPGEGWSDWFALMTTTSASHTGTDERSIGAYAQGGVSIRPYPYTTDMTANPLTFGDVRSDSSIYHIGQVWASALWDLTWAFVDRDGFDVDLAHGSGGNNTVMQLVVDALKIQTCDPGLVDARDALIAADAIANDGGNRCLIWETFARRGLGVGADQGDPNDHTDGVEAFDVPASCRLAVQVFAPSRVLASDAFSYTIVVTNGSTASQESVVVSSILPPGSQLVPAETSCQTSTSSGAVDVLFGRIEVGERRRCEIVVRAPAEPTSRPPSFRDDVETGGSPWEFDDDYGWTIDSAIAHSGQKSMYASDAPTNADAVLVTRDPFAVTDVSRLTFWHRYDLETSWDGGVVEARREGGASWIDLGPYVETGGYTGTIRGDASNVLAGRSAFSGEQQEFVQTAVDLGFLAGESVRLRFRLGTDESAYRAGWWIDDVEVTNDVMLWNMSTLSDAAGIVETVMTSIALDARPPDTATTSPATTATVVRATTATTAVPTTTSTTATPTTTITTDVPTTTITTTSPGTGTPDEAEPLSQPIWQPLSPTRFVDTRPGTATVDGRLVGDGKRPERSTLTIPVAGRNGVPADARAVIANITAVEPEADGYLRADPCDLIPTPSSSVNYPAGRNVGNEVIVGLDESGSFCLFTLASAHVTVDVVGFVPDGSNLVSMRPGRFLDTRADEVTFDGLGAGIGRLTDGVVIELPIAGRGGVPADATAVVVNVGAVGPTAPGFVTVHPCLDERPTASSLNFDVGVTVANQLLAHLDADGRLCLFVRGESDLIVDVAGFSTDASGLDVVGPARLLDTRPNGLTIDGRAAGRGQIPAGYMLRLPVAGRSGIPRDATTVVLNMAVVDPANDGFITVYPCLETPPRSSSLNYTADVTSANEIVATLDGNGHVCVFARTTIDVIADVVAVTR